jgi:predicted phage terminase large subunit-like protein
MTNCDNYVNLLLRRDLIQEIDRELATRSLREFVRQAWPVLQPTTPFVPGWHIDALCEHLEAITYGQIRNLLINIPPRHMKSLTVSVFWPCWEWIRWPERRWLYSSYAESLSLRDSRQCRILVLSPWYQRNWGDVFMLADDQNEKRRFENDKTGYRIASSVGGANTGEGGDRVVCDDPHNVKEAESDAARKGVCDWYDQVMSTRVNDPKTAARVIIMQRVHEADLSGHVLAQGGYEHLCLPAEYEESKRTTVIGWSDPRTELGELLWPERFGPAEIADLKLRLGSYGSAGQLQQRPSPAEGGILKRSWWRRYDRLENLPGFEMIQSWDLAFKDTRNSSYVVGQVWARSGAYFCLVDQVRAKMTFPETLQAFRELSAKYPECQAKLVEDKANGPALIQTLQREIPGIIAVEPDGSKEARAHAVSWLIEAGNVFLPQSSVAPWVDDFIEECAAFPKGAYADQVDCCTQALSRLQHGWPQQGVIYYYDPVQISPV